MQVRAISTCRDSSNLSATMQVCDLDSVIEFSLKQITDQIASQLDSVMEFAKFHYAI